MAGLDMAQALSRYQPQTQNTIRRSQYLQDALEQIGQGPKKDPQSIAEALARVAETFVLKRGSDKANTALAEALRGERSAEDARALAGLPSFDVPAAPAMPQPPAQAAPQAMSPSAPQALAAALTAPQNRSNGTSPIGIRQNNPGNIRDTSIPWQGAVGAAGGFETFDKPENGLRALARNLQTYGKRGLNTPEAIIGRWAPPNENNTGAYVGAVSQALGVPPNAPLNMNDPQTLAKLAGAIIQHENGQNPYSPDQIMGGVQAAMGGPSVAQPQPMQPQPMQAPPAAAMAPQAPPPPPMPQAMQAPQTQQITQQEVEFAKSLLADPNQRAAGLAYIADLKRRAVTPIKQEMTVVNGVPVAFNPYNPQAGAQPLALPDGIRNRTVTAEAAGINAPAGTVFSESPTGKLDQVYAPPAGYERTQSGMRAERGSAADPTSGANLIEGEAKLRNEYAKTISEYQAARNGYAKVVQAAGDLTPAGAIAMVFGVMKTLDPTSTVREGEAASVQNSGTIDQSIVNLYNKLLGGTGSLTPEQRAQFAETARRQFSVYEGRAQSANERFKTLAESYGFDPNRIIEPLSPVEGYKLPAGPAKSPVKGARQGKDGGWYVEDPNKKGSFPRLQQAPDGSWYIRSATGQGIPVR